MKRLLSLILFAMILMNVNAYSESATGTLQEMYAQAELSMATGDYGGAAAQFEALGAYSDASQMAMYCKAIMAAETLGMYDIAVSAFHDLGDFKDSKQMATYYTARGYQAKGDLFDLSDITSVSDDGLSAAKDYYDEAANTFAGLALFKDCLTRMAECQAKSDAIEAEQKARLAAKNEAAYQEAMVLEANGEYLEAIETFTEIIDYKDSKEHIMLCIYKHALVLEESGEYQKAIDRFKKIQDYKDSKAHIEACENAIMEGIYQEALALEESGKYQDAIDVFKTIIDYKDSEAHIADCKKGFIYQDALSYENKEDYREAIKLYHQIEDYKDSIDRITHCIEEAHNTYKLTSKQCVVCYTDKIVSVQDIPQSEWSAPIYTITYSYDETGNLCETTKDTWNYELPEIETLKRDGDGIIISGEKSGSWTNKKGYTYKSKTQYDDHENVIQETITYKNPENYTYDEHMDGEMNVITHEYTYDMYDNITRDICYKDGEKKDSMSYTYEYTYDNDGRVVMYKEKADNASFSWIHYYTYDELGFIVLEEYEPDTKPEGQLRNYTRIEMTYN